MKKIVLASKSPRRQELFRSIHVPFVVRETTVNEGMYKKIHRDPLELVKTLALLKAEEAAGFYDDAVVIGADTICVVEGTILGKPKDEKDAIRMLQLLSGRKHTVHTGYACIDTLSKKVLSGIELAEVFFRKITDEQILKYIATGEPMDKAGAYGIQGRASIFVKRIEGEYSTVVGLPVGRIVICLEQLGVDIAEYWAGSSVG